ncbi:AAA family ATPase [Mumia sp. zg.B53]|uniref:BTAD domain-containing putative transcriptional regulator n=1 Tax=Mumia sp. zg.B53 TaxID=2855449 RepID=UPI001C6DDB06|nr:BTAD domain-containing putative transcriptional regulator [Mumia sp. zg.B53]MBW9216901.1 AAA family ATPase [Mumia sp. zg.B53]
MWLAVLGPVEMHREQASPPVALGTRKHRVLLATLALGAGSVQSVDTLIDYLWSGHPPAGAHGTLQAYVSGLRRALATVVPDEADPPLRTSSGGYVLDTSSLAIDAATASDLMQEAHRRLGPLVRHAVPGPGVVEADVLEQAARDLDAATGLWRGRPYEELGEHPQAVAERARLDELRLVACEDRAAVRLAQGEHATVAAELESLTTQHPLRERLWTLRAVALARSGRQADALQAVRVLTSTLDEDLGIQPGTQVQEVQAAILRQDPAITWTETTPSSPSTATAEPQTAPAPPRSLLPRGPQPRLPQLPAWPMVGRDRELAVLLDRYEVAETGRPQFACLVGEPGIGKSRLVAEVLARARERGARVLVGRCSQDSGAPPLWPWEAVLEGLGGDVPTAVGGDPDSERFAAWEQICRQVLDAADEQPLVVALDDLQWADPSSLGVLRHLCAVADEGRLLLMVTMRTHAEQDGAVAETLEALARRHAVSVALTGLSAAETGEVLTALSSHPVAPATARVMQERTDGNPFFVVEYARLLDEAGGDVALEPPTAVTDVVRRRLAAVPDGTLDVLRHAAVVGRRFDLPTVVSSTGLDDLTVLDRLEPATSAGMVRDEGDDRFRFSHALVRDAVYATLSPSRRQRMHARIAEALRLDQRASSRTAEIARHWADAGEDHAAQAWTSAYRAALAAQRRHGHEEAAELLALALSRIDLDPDATLSDRYELLLARADATRWAARWDDLTDAVEEAITVADKLGDPELLARAAVATTRGALWQSPTFGETKETIVGAQRRALAALPGGDSPLRCTLLISLANEVYYSATESECQLLVAEGLEMARRLGDDALLMEMCSAAFLAVWRPWTAVQRLALADEAVAIARRLGDARGEAMALAQRAAVHGELGHVEDLERDLAEADGLADDLQLTYVRWFLDCMRLPWLAMRGELEESRATLDGLMTLVDTIAVPHKYDAVGGLMLVLAIWGGLDDREDGVLDELVAAARVPIHMAATGFLLRLGRADAARELFETSRPTLDDESWIAPLIWGFGAEVGLALGDRDLAAAAYDRLAPLRGGVLSAGSTIAMGPVDAFLALAAAADDDTGLATRHADDAVRLMQTWQIPLAERWFLRQRDLHGF